jgi:putative oxidoreductase
MHGLVGIDSGWGVTVAPPMMAIMFIVSGYGKWAAGMAATAAGFAKAGIPAAGVAAPFIGTLELGGGVLLFLGFFTRPLGLLFALEMLVTAFYVKFPAPWWNPARIDLMLLATGILVIMAGPGRLAVDNAWLERPKANGRRSVRRT